jgi:hypothetical protein
MIVLQVVQGASVLPQRRDQVTVEEAAPAPPTVIVGHEREPVRNALTVK